MILADKHLEKEHAEVEDLEVDFPKLSLPWKALRKSSCIRANVLKPPFEDR